jgi:hypothetical protein
MTENEQRIEDSAKKVRDSAADKIYDFVNKVQESADDKVDDSANKVDDADKVKDSAADKVDDGSTRSMMPTRSRIPRPTRSRIPPSMPRTPSTKLDDSIHKVQDGTTAPTEKEQAETAGAIKVSGSHRTASHFALLRPAASLGRPRRPKPSKAASHPHRRSSRARYRGSLSQLSVWSLTGVAQWTNRPSRRHSLG